jgi:hypothetical protein
MGLTTGISYESTANTNLCLFPSLVNWPFGWPTSNEASHRTTRTIQSIDQLLLNRFSSRGGTGCNLYRKIWVIKKGRNF